MSVISSSSSNVLKNGSATSLKLQLPTTERTITKSTYETYPRSLKTAPEIHLPRVNPLRPLPPLRRTVALETVLPHYHNEQRAKLMQKREYHRYHNAWAKYYYGSNSDQESYKSYVRSVLKQQMAEKESSSKSSFGSRSIEAENALKYDQQCLSDDAKDASIKSSYMRQFRDQNKKMMEDNWMQKKSSRYLENQYDREILKYNPINWSCTLK